MNITRGKIGGAQKCLVYGPEGIGKSTLASFFPEPIYIDCEGGTKHLDIARFDRPSTWKELLEQVDYIIANPGICKTLVIDTADWAEKLAIEDVCRKWRLDSLESAGYGKGYVYLGETFQQLLYKLDKVVSLGIHVLILAHAKMRKFELPDEMGSYDRWELKLTRQVAPLIKEWCDMVLFANYKTYVVTTETNTRKAQGGKRVIYTSHHPCWDAKNRHSLPDEMDLDFANIAHLFKTPASAAESVLEETESDAVRQVRQLMERDGVTEEELVRFVLSKGHHRDISALAGYPDSFIRGWILKYWNNITEGISAARNH